MRGKTDFFAKSVRGCFRTQIVDGQGQMSQMVQGQTALIAGLEAKPVSEDWPDVFSASAAQQDGFEGGFEVNEQGTFGRKKESSGTRVLDGAATQTENQTVLAGQLADGLMFEFAKP